MGSVPLYLMPPGHFDLENMLSAVRTWNVYAGWGARVGSVLCDELLAATTSPEAAEAALRLLRL